MSNATQDSRNSGDNRRRRSRGGSNRNKNQGNDSRRNHQGGDRSHSRGDRSEEFRPQSASRPARVYSPAKLSLWQKILKAVGLYKAPVAPARNDRRNDSASSKEARPPKSNTRNARTEGETRAPREKREEGDRPARAPREGGRPRGGDPKTVESARVYVGNLSYDVSEQDLQELFKGIGGVRNVEIVYNRSTHRSKGYGFVEMLRMDEAIRAVEVLNDQHFMGRKMTVSGAKSKGQDDREDKDERSERAPKPVVLAPLASQDAAVEASSVEAQASPAVVEATPVAENEVAAPAADLEATFGFEPEVPAEKKAEEA